MISGYESTNIISVLNKHLSTDGNFAQDIFVNKSLISQMGIGDDAQKTAVKIFDWNGDNTDVWQTAKAYSARTTKLTPNLTKTEHVLLTNYNYNLEVLLKKEDLKIDGQKVLVMAVMKAAEDLQTRKELNRLREILSMTADNTTLKLNTTGNTKRTKDLATKTEIDTSVKMLTAIQALVKEYRAANNPVKDGVLVINGSYAHLLLGLDVYQQDPVLRAQGFSGNIFGYKTVETNAVPHDTNTKWAICLYNKQYLAEKYSWETKPVVRECAAGTGYTPGDHMLQGNIRYNVGLAVKDDNKKRSFLRLTGNRPT